MKNQLITSLVVLGVPGVALGVFYLLLRQLGFKFETIGATWSAMIALVFILIVGGVTLYALQLWAPPHPPIAESKNGRPDGPIDEKYGQAAAFQISWLVMSLLTGNARHPEAVYEQIRVHCKELELELPTAFREEIRVDDEGASVMQLVGNLGGQLVAKRPSWTAYFEAGFNLPLDVGRSDGSGVAAFIRPLDIPEGLRSPREDKLAWINLVHEHFEKILRAKRGQPEAAQHGRSVGGSSTG